MSKRLYPSGSEKRKKAAHQKELIETLPKLESYFTKREASISSHQLTNPPPDESCRPQITVSSKSSYSTLTSIFLLISEKTSNHLNQIMQNATVFVIKKQQLR